MRCMPFPVQLPPSGVKEVVLDCHLRGAKPIGTAKQSSGNQLCTTWKESEVKLARCTVNSTTNGGSVNPVLTGRPTLLWKATVNSNNKNLMDSCEELSCKAKSIFRPCIALTIYVSECQNVVQTAKTCQIIIASE